MIQKIFTENVIYISEKEQQENGEFRTVVCSCKFEPTSYGSVLVNRPTSNTTLELYPNQITHIIHDLIPLT